MKTQEERAARRQKIKDFFQRVLSWLTGAEQKLEGMLPVIIDTSLKVMTWFKAVANNQIVDFIVHFTPTKADDFVVEKIRAAIDKTIDGLTGAKYCMSLPTFEDKVQCFKDLFLQLPEDARSGYLMQFHSKVMQELSDNKLGRSEASYLASKAHLGENLTLAT